MSKHTPGPWEVVESTIGSGKRRSALDTFRKQVDVYARMAGKYVTRGIPPGRAADAKLMAAAPEMYKLLNEAEYIFANGLEDEHECVDLWRRISDVLNPLRGTDENEE